MSTKKRLSRVKTETEKITTDILTLDASIMDLEEKLEVLYEPVEKDDTEIFMVLDGALYVDVEYEDEKWLRVFLERGDLVIVPKGRPHRCTTTPTVS